MNEQDKKAMLEAKDRHVSNLEPSEIGYAPLDFSAGWQSALEYARGQQEPVALVPQNWTVFNSGAEVKRDLSFEEAWDYMTPERLARGWCAVCVADESNQPSAQPVQPAVNEQMLEALKAAQYRLKEYGYQAMKQTIEKVDAAIAAAETNAPR